MDHPQQEPPQIAGYALEGVLGRGGMGVVYKATQTSIGRTVALKVLHHDRVTKPDARERFLAEARRTAALSHRHLVTVHDAAVDAASGMCFYTMEYVHGRTLSTVLNQGGALACDIFSTLAHQIADALAHAHRAGVVHRDLKPDNILIDEHGHARITDLGLAVDRIGRSSSNNRRRLSLVGTPGWSAPEQARNPERISPAADVFSYGAVLYAMATAAEPFDGETVIDLLINVCTEEPPLLPELDAPIRHLIQACLAKNPDQRPADGSALVDLLAVPTAGSRSSGARRSRRGRRRR